MTTAHHIICGLLWTPHSSTPLFHQKSAGRGVSSIVGGAHEVDICIIIQFCGYFAATGGEQLCEPNIALLKENGKPGSLGSYVTWEE